MFMVGELGLLVSAANPAGLGCVLHSFSLLTVFSSHVTPNDVSSSREGGSKSLWHLPFSNIGTRSCLYNLNKIYPFLKKN